MVHANQIRPFKHPKGMSKEMIETLAAIDLDEFYVEKLLDIQARLRASQLWVSIVRRNPTSI